MRRMVSRLSMAPRPLPAAKRFHSTLPLIQEDDSINRRYADLLQELYRNNEKLDVVKQGLENIQKLNTSLGSPSKEFKTIHVTGTNGKGSVCWKLSKALRASGLRTGLFMSPHVSCFRERIRVDDELISERQIAELLPIIMQTAADESIPATFFEYVTALAFKHFAESQVDIVVLEAGLGGRLDSTNIIPDPSLTIITNVGLEHKKILGPTVEDIAYEKACIAKPNSPMLVGPKVPETIVRKVCEEINAPLHILDELPPSDNYDLENIACVEAAIGILGLDPVVCKDALLERPPCRFEHVVRDNSLFILDVAHNHPALMLLFKTLRRKLEDSRSPSRRVQLVLALSSDKDVVQCLSAIQENSDLLDSIYFTKAHCSRAQDPRLLRDVFEKTNAKNAVETFVVDNVTTALDMASKNGNGDHLTLVCGTLFMMGEARQFLNMNAPFDPNGILHKPPK